MEEQNPSCAKASGRSRYKTKLCQQLTCWHNLYFLSEDNMPKRSHHKKSQSKTSALLRSPIVQIAIVAVAALVIYLLAV